MRTRTKIDQILPFAITPVNTAQMQITNKLEEEEIPKIYKKEDIIIKPPNVLICTNSVDTAENVKALLTKILDPERYVVRYHNIVVTGHNKFDFFLS